MYTANASHTSTSVESSQSFGGGGRPCPSAEEYPLPDFVVGRSLIVYRLDNIQASDLGEKAITALHHNTICINAHKSRNFFFLGGGDIDTSVSSTPNFGGLSSRPLPGSSPRHTSTSLSLLCGSSITKLITHYIY